MRKVSILYATSLGALFLTAVVVGCGKTDTRSTGTKNIFGNDTRQKANTNVLPYSAIGRIDSGCTGFLIGKNLAATAAHCIVDSSTGALKKRIHSFGMNFKDGVPQTTAKIRNAWIGSFNPEDSREKDWAVLELDKALGAHAGFLSLDYSALATTVSHGGIALAGFQSDFEKGDVLAVDQKCSVKKILEDGRFFFDCDSYAGISGAPLLRMFGESAVVIGIAVSEYRSGAATSVHRDEYSEDYANVALSLKDMAPVASELKSSFDGGSTPQTVAGAFHVAVPEPEPDTRITLVSDAPFSGGTFRDDQNQIVCGGIRSNCSGTYVKGTDVTLTAPPSLIAWGRMLWFQYWVCVDAASDFSSGQNVCVSRGRQCRVQVTRDLKCSAWFQ